MEGLPGIHDISPFANAQILNAERVFAQGFGMEGPSGDFSLQDNIPDSYGLTALHKGENTMLAYAEDHRLFGLCFCIADRQHFSACFNLEGTGGAFLTLPTLYFEESDGLCDGLHICAQRIPHQPKMKNGSRMILVTAPMIWVHIEYFVRPVDCRKQRRPFLRLVFSRESG